MSRRLIWLPTRTRENTPRISLVSLMAIGSTSSSGSFESSTTMAVISLVIEAIGTTRSGLRE